MNKVYDRVYKILSGIQIYAITVTSIIDAK